MKLGLLRIILHFLLLFHVHIYRCLVAVCWLQYIQYRRLSSNITNIRSVNKMYLFYFILFICASIFEFFFVFCYVCSWGLFGWISSRVYYWFSYLQLRYVGVFKSFFLKLLGRWVAIFLLLFKYKFFVALTLVIWYYNWAAKLLIKHGVFAVVYVLLRVIFFKVIVVVLQFIIFTWASPYVGYLTTQSVVYLSQLKLKRQFYLYVSSLRTLSLCWSNIARFWYICRQSLSRRNVTAWKALSTNNYNFKWFQVFKYFYFLKSCQPVLSNFKPLITVFFSVFFFFVLVIFFGILGILSKTDFFFFFIGYVSSEILLPLLQLGQVLNQVILAYIIEFDTASWFYVLPQSLGDIFYQKTFWRILRRDLLENLWFLVRDQRIFDYDVGRFITQVIYQNFMDYTVSLKLLVEELKVSDSVWTWYGASSYNLNDLAVSAQGVPLTQLLVWPVTSTYHEFWSILVLKFWGISYCICCFVSADISYFISWVFFFFFDAFVLFIRLFELCLIFPATPLLDLSAFLCSCVSTINALFACFFYFTTLVKYYFYSFLIIFVFFKLKFLYVWLILETLFLTSVFYYAIAWWAFVNINFFFIPAFISIVLFGGILEFLLSLIEFFRVCFFDLIFLLLAFVKLNSLFVFNFYCLLGYFVHTCLTSLITFFYLGTISYVFVVLQFVCANFSFIGSILLEFVLYFIEFLASVFTFGVFVGGLVDFNSWLYLVFSNSIGYFVIWNTDLWFGSFLILLTNLCYVFLSRWHARNNFLAVNYWLVSGKKNLIKSQNFVEAAPRSLDVRLTFRRLKLKPGVYGNQKKILFNDINLMAKNLYVFWFFFMKRSQKGRHLCAPTHNSVGGPNLILFKYREDFPDAQFFRSLMLRLKGFVCTGKLSNFSPFFKVWVNFYNLLWSKFVLFFSLVVEFFFWTFFLTTDGWATTIKNRLLSGEVYLLSNLQVETRYPLAAMPPNKPAVDIGSIIMFSSVPLFFNSVGFESNYWFNEQFLITLQSNERFMSGNDRLPQYYSTQMYWNSTYGWRTEFNSRVLQEFAMFDTSLQFLNPDLSEAKIVNKYLTAYDENNFYVDEFKKNRRGWYSQLAFKDSATESFFRDLVNDFFLSTKFWYYSFLFGDKYKRIRIYTQYVSMTDNEAKLDSRVTEAWVRWDNGVVRTVTDQHWILDFFSFLLQNDLYSITTPIYSFYLFTFDTPFSPDFPDTVYKNITFFTLLRTGTIRLTSQYTALIRLNSRLGRTWRFPKEFVTSFRSKYMNYFYWQHYGWWEFKRRVRGMRNFVPHPYLVFEQMLDFPLPNLPVQDNYSFHLLSPIAKLYDRTRIDAPKLSDVSSKKISSYKVWRKSRVKRRRWWSFYFRRMYYMRRYTYYLNNVSVWVGSPEGRDSNLFFEKGVFRMLFLNDTQRLSHFSRYNNLMFRDSTMLHGASMVERFIGRWSLDSYPHTVFSQPYYFLFWARHQAFMLKSLEYEKYVFMRSLKYSRRRYRYYKRNRSKLKYKYLRKNQFTLTPDSLDDEKEEEVARAMRTQFFSVYRVDRYNNTLSNFFQNLRADSAIVLDAAFLYSRVPSFYINYDSFVINLTDSRSLWVLKDIRQAEGFALFVYFADYLLIILKAGLIWFASITNDYNATFYYKTQPLFYKDIVDNLVEFSTLPETESFSERHFILYSLANTQFFYVLPQTCIYSVKYELTK